MPILVGDPELCKKTSDRLLEVSRHLYPADQLSNRTARHRGRLRIHAVAAARRQADRRPEGRASGGLEQSVSIPFAEPSAPQASKFGPHHPVDGFQGGRLIAHRI
ncbi:hypothetical protein VXQ18_11810 [Brucella abortus]|nr:hypothetical protein [Brucella abortus]